MTRNKKIIISAVVVVVLIVLICVGTIFTIGLIDKNNNTKKVIKVTPTTKTVTDLRANAEKARASGNKEDAKTLLTQAQQQVEALPKTDQNTNAKVDIQAQLFLLEHANK
ncbi:MAG: hypothetical protein NTV39_03035 [Candidatus Saccharibacteria bacterium]|nr:hypothetical protein [Candidatus Saccharibacteria bacterium]